MTGAGKVEIRSHRRRIRSAIATASSCVRTFASSFRSPPEMKARSPPPLMTTTLASRRAVQGRVQRVHGRGADRVAHLGPVDRDDGHPFVQVERYFGHEVLHSDIGILIFGK